MLVVYLFGSRYRAEGLVRPIIARHLYVRERAPVSPVTASAACELALARSISSISASTSESSPAVDVGTKHPIQRPVSPSASAPTRPCAVLHARTSGSLQLPEGKGSCAGCRRAAMMSSAAGASELHTVRAAGMGWARCAAARASTTSLDSS